jgi:putative Ca2+/H+ antiporter (TMEM165/GDT1 family)
MEPKTLLVVFCIVFLAELGDKTQLATVLFAANRANSAWLVFVAASVALIAACGIAVVAGSLLAQHVNTRYLTVVAGLGFIVIGLGTLRGGVRASVLAFFAAHQLFSCTRHDASVVLSQTNETYL